MYKQLLRLEWKSFFRSANKGQNIAMKILLGFLAVYFGISYLILGLALYPLISEYFPDTAPIHVVNKYAVTWIVLEFFIRYMMQKLPILNIKPFLTSNILKKDLIHFVLHKSAFSFFNFLAPLIFIPFGIWSIIKSDISFLQLMGWWLSMCSIVMTINYLNLYFNKKFSEDIRGLIPVIILITGFYALDHYNIFKITDFSGTVLDFALAHPYLAAIPAAIAVSSYLLNFHYLKKHFYLDAAFKTKSANAGTSDFSWTRKFGSIAPFLQQDLRLIWRNKRPRSTAIMSLMFTAYGLIFFTAYDTRMEFMIAFLGIFMTGIFAINFGQFIPAWDSSYFPMMMTQNISMKQYLTAKAGLMYFSIVILTILTTPYVYFGADVLIAFIGCGIYNAGINIPLILLAGSFNKKRIDLDKTQFMNYQGTGAAQWVISIPLLIIPIILWNANYFIFNATAASVFLAAIGIIGLFLRKVFMNYIVSQYKKRKHAMISGFREAA